MMKETRNTQMGNRKIKIVVWFYILVFFVSLFISVVKRQNEIKLAQSEYQEIYIKYNYIISSEIKFNLENNNKLVAKDNLKRIIGIRLLHPEFINSSYTQILKDELNDLKHEFSEDK